MIDRSCLLTNERGLGSVESTVKFQDSEFEACNLKQTLWSYMYLQGFTLQNHVS